jgi:hypothetical protein
MTNGVCVGSIMSIHYTTSSLVMFVCLSIMSIHYTTSSLVMFVCLSIMIIVYDIVTPCDTL